VIRPIGSPASGGNPEPARLGHPGGVLARGGRPIPLPSVLFLCLYPEPGGFAEAPVDPGEAFYSTDLREFILPCDAVRQATSPDDTLLDFLQTTYEAAAGLASWERESLERAHEPGRGPA
jgi:hypothetical protein